MKDKLKGYENYLISEEKSEATVKKYIRDVQVFTQLLGERELSKSVVQEYKQKLMTEYEIKSVNSIISSLNSFFDWCGHSECRVKNLKIQKEVFCEPNRELTREEYECLLRTAKEQGKKRLCLVMQTICATGIRISEDIYCKG